MAVAGALISEALGAFGRKPEIPKLPAIDPAQVQAATIAGNKGALPELEAIGAQVNSFNLAQQLGMLGKALDFLAPGQLQQVQANNASLLRGEVPKDVQAQLQRQAVAGAYGRGYGGGSGIAQNDYLRSLGLTSLQLQQQGQAGFGQLASMAPQTPLFNPSSMFFTPQQRLEAAFSERQAQFQRNLLAEQIAAAPDPATAALGKEIDRFFNTAASIGTMAAGGMGG